MDFIADELAPLVESLTPKQRRRIAGLGVAAPFQLWNWAAEIGAPADKMDAWRSFSIEEELARVAPFSVTLCNDATSACAAEFFFGEARRRPRLPLLLPRRLRRRRAGPRRRALSRPHRQRRRRRLDADRRAGGRRFADLAIDLPRLDLPAPAADRRGGTRPLVALAHAGDLGRFRSVARRLDRRGRLRARLRLARRDVGHRRRSDRHRRRDAVRRARAPAPEGRGATRRARPARLVGSDDRRRLDRGRRAGDRRGGAAADQGLCARPRTGVQGRAGRTRTARPAPPSRRRAPVASSGP